MLTYCEVVLQRLSATEMFMTWTMKGQTRLCPQIHSMKFGLTGQMMMSLGNNFWMRYDCIYG